MEAAASNRARSQKTFGWLGALCLLLIIPLKALRWTTLGDPAEFLVGVLPSLLGPAGLLFLLLSSSGRLSKLSLLQVSLGVGALAAVLEFAQLLPRPGILAQVNYTFDWYDVLASAGSVLIGYIVARVLGR